MPMNTQDEPFVSVVTPVYNTEKYLSTCIESVLAQTYRNFEYVIVDNKSTDASLEIARKYADKDPRIRVHENTDFLSVMPNWNNALRQISSDSKYCKVVHADDWIFPECLTRMVEVAEEHPTVGLVSAYRLAESQVDLDRLPYPTPFIPGRELGRRLLLESYCPLFGTPTSVLLRSDLVRKREAFYNEQNIHADSEACYETLLESDFGFVHQVLTFTRRHNDSMTSLLNRYRTHRAGRLLCLLKFGPRFLEPEEYKRRLRTHVDSYHRFLVEGVFGGKKRDFWKYHKNVFKEQGVKYSRLAVLKYFFIGAVERLARPRRALRDLLRGPQVTLTDEKAASSTLDKMTG